LFFQFRGGKNKFHGLFGLIPAAPLMVCTVRAKVLRRLRGLKHGLL